MQRSPKPVPEIAGITPYRVPRAGAPTDLVLDGNEGAVPPEDLLDALRAQVPGVLRDYPSTGGLAADLAARLGVAPEQVVVTAGADDALDRVCRAVLAPGREVILPVPGFEMIARYAALAGGEAVHVAWPEGAFPTDAVLGAVTERTALIVVTSPNNPTGAVATAEDLRRLSAGAPGAVLLVDLAYVEFADEDLTAAALALPNAVVTRTLSKAWGLAGLRVGYAAGPAEIVGWLRVAGAPYAVAGPSVALARARLRSGEAEMAAFVGRIREEREALESVCAEVGLRPVPSQANFLLLDAGDAVWLRDAMAGLGIAVRAFPGRADLEGRVRIALPGDGSRFERLAAALRVVRAPEALLFDLDGVLADVSGSFRVAIRETCAAFGVRVDFEAIAAIKREGDANDDWVVSQRLIARGGVQASLPEVTATFERLYQGADGEPGLRERERLLVSRSFLEGLAARVPLGIVTGRPRGDADRFLGGQGIADLFGVVVCKEDGPIKPDPFPVREALRRLGVTRAWMVGDTADDVRAARAGGVLPLGVVAPGEDRVATEPNLVAAGAARVLDALGDLEDLWP